MNVVGSFWIKEIMALRLQDCYIYLYDNKNSWLLFDYKAMRNELLNAVVILFV